MAASHFYITGLPRTRTAWLANWFTHKNSYCFHELSKYGKDFYELQRVVKSRTEMFIGTADSGFPLYHQQFLQYVPGKIVVIERDPKEVMDSYKEDFGSEMTIELVDQLLNELELIKAKKNPLVMQYEDLDDIQKLKSLWNYCAPTIKMDEDRTKMLMELTVKVHPQKYLENLDADKFKKLIGAL